MSQQSALKVPGTEEILEALKTGRIIMSPTVANASADVQELLDAGLVVYDGKALSLPTPQPAS